MSEYIEREIDFTPQRIDRKAIRLYQRGYSGTLAAEAIDDWRPDRNKGRLALMKPTRIGPFYPSEAVFCRRLEQGWTTIAEQDSFVSEVEVMAGYLLDSDSILRHQFGSTTEIPLNRKLSKGSEKTGLAYGFIANVPIPYATSPWIVGILDDEYIIFDRHGRFDFEKEGIVPSAILGRKVFLPHWVNDTLFRELVGCYGLDVNDLEAGLLHTLTARLLHRVTGRRNISELLSVPDLEV